MTEEKVYIIIYEDTSDYEERFRKAETKTGLKDELEYLSHYENYKILGVYVCEELKFTKKYTVDIPKPKKEEE